MPNSKGRREGTRRITVWAHGRQHEWVFEGTKAEGALFEASKRIALGAGRKLDPPPELTFSSFCDLHYRPYAETHLGPDTWSKVRVYQVITLIQHFGALRLTELKPFDLDQYKTTRLATLRKGVKPSATAVNNELRVLRAMLNWARGRSIPVADLKIEMLPARGAKRVMWWTAPQIAKLYTVTRRLEPALLPLLVFLLNTGCRKGEALAAEWSWLDIKAGMIRIPVTEEWQPKNKKPREVPLADAVKAALAGPRKSERWIFPNVFGERYVTFPKEAFWKVRKAARLTGGPHTTRHTFATHFLQAVPDLFLLATVLGHSHVRMTELYSHLLPDHLARARNAVNLGPRPIAAKVASRG
ncbi:MAG: phage integrase family protein [Myxococcaceae bacterium]|nr:phage integrase family protein [Myxococcaceae bacterium]